MTTTFTPTLSVHLTSMRPPEAHDTRQLTLHTNPQDVTTKDIVIYPGIASDMIVHVTNLRDRELRCRIELKGDIPRHWYPALSDQTLAAHQSHDFRISFQSQETPDQLSQRQDFFENQQSIHPRQPTLNLDYQGQIHVFVERATGTWQLIGYEAFTLHVRPISTYLAFLPGLYQESDFTRRFLSIFEETFDPSVQTIETLWAYLDPLTAPRAFLPFLSHWVAWENDPQWDLHRQRRLIRHAIELYRWHGTRHGLRFYLHLYTNLPLDEHLPEHEKHINIEEVFNRGFIFGETRIGQDSMIGGGKPYHFIVRLRSADNVQLNREKIETIIETYKPAFCTYELQIN